MIMLPKAIYRFNEIPDKFPMAFFFTEQVHMNKKSVQNTKVKTVLRKKNRAGEIILPEFRLNCKAIIIKVV